MSRGDLQAWLWERLPSLGQWRRRHLQLRPTRREVAEQPVRHQKHDNGDDYQGDPKDEDEPDLHVALFVMPAHTVSTGWRLSHARSLPVNVGRAVAGGVAFAVATQRRRSRARQYQEAPRRPTSGG